MGKLKDLLLTVQELGYEVDENTDISVLEALAKHDDCAKNAQDLAAVLQSIADTETQQAKDIMEMVKFTEEKFFNGK